MQYFLGTLLFLLVAASLFGCNEESAISYQEEYYFGTDNNLSSEEYNKSLKVQAEKLTPSGRREDGWFQVNYQQPGYKDIVVLVKRAQDYLRINGRVKALDDFMSPESQFVAGRVYIFAYSTSGECLADWAEPGRIGCYIDGELFSEALVKAYDGGGWFEEEAFDPVSKTMRQKESYVLFAGNDIILGAGLYKN